MASMPIETLGMQNLQEMMDYFLDISWKYKTILAKDGATILKIFFLFL